MFYFQYFGTLFYVISGILLLSIPNRSEIVVAVRLTNGVGHGLIHFVSIIYCSEIASKYTRIQLIHFLYFGQIIGISIFTIVNMYLHQFAVFNQNGLSVNRVLGMISLPTSILVLVIIKFTMIESPVHLLEKDFEGNAFKNLQKLQLENDIETRHYLNEFKSLIHPKSISIFNDIKMFIIIILVKLMYVSSFNYTLNLLSIDLSAYLFDWRTFYYYSPPTLILSHLAGVLLFLLLINKISSTFLFTLVGITCGFLLIAVGVIFDQVNNYAFWLLPVLFIIFKFISGFGLGSSDSLLSESFSYNHKQHYISASFVIENICQIVFCIILLEQPRIEKSFYYMNMYVLGGIITFLTCSTTYFIPNNKEKSLLEIIQKDEHNYA